MMKMVRENMMEQQSVVFTVTDRVILNSYRSVLDGLAVYLGDGFEFVLHSLEDYDSSVIKIINGHHTGRKIGAPITDLAINMLSKIQEEKLDGAIAYNSRNKKGSPLRSTTIVIHGELHRPIGLLCINFYIDTPLSETFPFFDFVANDTTGLSSENFATDVDTMIEQAYEEASNKVMSDASISPLMKNKEIVNVLNNHGIFKMKDSVVKVAEVMGVSKNTVYMHLRNSKNS